MTAFIALRKPWRGDRLTPHHLSSRKRRSCVGRLPIVAPEELICRPIMTRPPRSEFDGITVRR